jgi:hypothetical protein
METGIGFVMPNPSMNNMHWLKDFTSKIKLSLMLILIDNLKFQCGFPEIKTCVAVLIRNLAKLAFALPNPT